MPDSHTQSNSAHKGLIVVPVYNDWENAAHLLQDLDSLDLSGNWQVLLVDDGSTEGPQAAAAALKSAPPQRLQAVHLLPLVRNLGHQRAIATGLAYATDHLDFDFVVVMDADGEDRPQDLPRLLNAVDDSQSSTAVFARRGRRSESLLFRIFYLFYRFLFWVLTGTGMHFGNFSILPRAVVRRLVVSSELWMHYAGSIFKLKIPFKEISADRGERYTGESRMGLVGLILHGLQAIAIYREIACVRIILTCLAASLGLVIGIGVVVFLRVFTDLAIPGWASNVVSLFLIMIFQIMTLALFFIFLVLGSRSGVEMLPVRDYKLFIDPAQVLWSQSSSPS